MRFEPISVLNIEGHFFVPDYQRGYRWEDSEVRRLLDDIYECDDKTMYYLQPIVVKRLEDGSYELVDGQQRLTTLYLILKQMQSVCSDICMCYDFSYETRQETEEYLQKIDYDRRKEDIDFFFIANAFETIKQWFEKKQKAGMDLLEVIKALCNKLEERVQVIWYEPEGISGVELFTRLNIGRIPLTNSELVRALFLSRNSGLGEDKQLAIASEWDQIEKELHNPSLWAFLTNATTSEYPNRIELLFDMMADGFNKKDKYTTFFFFNEKIRETESKLSVWEDIIAYYERLKEWYQDREIYHKVGYLVSQNQNNLRKLLQESEAMKKSELKDLVNQKIVESLKDIDSVIDLDYANDYSKVKRVLLLFNVLSVMNIDDAGVRFPFDRYKENNWSLEHIHAQNAEVLTTNEKRVAWLDLHLKALKKNHQEKNPGLVDELEKIVEQKTVTGEQFKRLQDEVFECFSDKTDGAYIDNLSNLALLNFEDNAALNNSVFEVKRQKIIQMEQEGRFIPYCTRMVFLKYYNPDATQLDSWNKDDRDAYMNRIDDTLKSYLQPIQNKN